MKALLRAKANTELIDKDGDTALQVAEARGHAAREKKRTSESESERTPAAPRRRAFLQAARGATI